MNRRAFMTGLGVVLAAPFAAEAQQTAKIVRIGLLDYAVPDSASDARWNAFRERLRELGYVEGQNLVLERRWGQGKPERLPGLAAELVAVKVDIIVTAGSEAALAAKRATTSIPIVMATGADPVALGLAAGLAHPGGNVTGVISLIAQLIVKRLELLKQLMPHASRIAVMRDPNNRPSAFSLGEAETAAKSFGVIVHGINVRSPSDLDGAFVAMKRSGTDAVIFAENTRFIANRRRIADLAIMHRLPMLAAAKEYAESGALVSYGTDYLDLFRRAAPYVERIVKGAKPGDLPIEQPTKFELVINLKTAKALGLTIAQSLLLRADQVIE
jgi:putative tryptophan/tyrosine transport system substrate-binding protein